VTNTPAKGARNSKKPQAGGRVFCIDIGEALEDPNATVIGTLLVNRLYSHVLFDSGSILL